jgi:hypothetical protein
VRECVGAGASVIVGGREGAVVDTAVGRGGVCQVCVYMRQGYSITPRWPRPLPQCPCPLTKRVRIHPLPPRLPQGTCVLKGNFKPRSMEMVLSTLQVGGGGRRGPADRPALHPPAGRGRARPARRRSPANRRRCAPEAADQRRAPVGRAAPMQPQHANPMQGARTAAQHALNSPRPPPLDSPPFGSRCPLSRLPRCCCSTRRTS